MIVLGAGVLLLAAALELARLHATVRRGAPGGRRAGDDRARDRPVVAVASHASCTCTVLLLFVLIAALVLSERVPAGRGWPACGVVTIAAAVAIVFAPGLQRSSPWLDVQTLAGTLGPSRGEAFDWSQTYGPLVWPHTGTVVLDVHTSRYPTYWKAVDLDEFDSRAWVSAPVGGDEQQAFQTTVTAATQARWRQVLTITLRHMSTSAVIAAGVAYPPSIAGFRPGDAFGTYASATPLRPGDAYQVAVYAPQPSPAALARAGTDYPTADLTPELEMLLAGGAGASVGARERTQPIQFAPYGSQQSLEEYAGLTSAQALARLNASPYRPVYALAQRLRRGTSTPYAVRAGGDALPLLRVHVRHHATGQRSADRQLPVQHQARATASSSPARWRCCCAWAASRRTSRPGSRPGPTTPQRTPTRSATSTRTPGWRPGSRDTAG